MLLWEQRSIFKGIDGLVKKIPAKERFNQHEKSFAIEPELIEEAAKMLGMDPLTIKIFRLVGGFMNANFKVSDNVQSVVIRVYSTDEVTAQREFDLLKFLEDQPVLTPRALKIFKVQGRPVVALEFIDGETFEERLLRSSSLELEVFEQIGKQLALIHNIRFKECGFIGPKVHIGRQYDNFSEFIRQYIETTLRDLELCADKLDLVTNKRLRRLVDDKWNLVSRTEPLCQLVHTDFNPKNIMVSKDSNPKIAAIIDWEFCLSGNGLIDLGNFFRFSYDYPEGARQSFTKAYRMENPELADEWEDASRLLDLGNMCSFLERQENYQKSFGTARAVIQSTLEYFGF